MPSTSRGAAVSAMICGAVSAGTLPVAILRSPHADAEIL
jgi:hypothetical protein